MDADEPGDVVLAADDAADHAGRALPADGGAVARAADASAPGAARRGAGDRRRAGAVAGHARADRGAPGADVAERGGRERRGAEGEAGGGRHPPVSARGRDSTTDHTDE